MARVRTASPSQGVKATKLSSTRNPKRVRNAGGGISFRSEDAAQRLINRIGVPNFNEPTYYGGSGNRVINDRSDLTDVAQAIIADAEELAQSSDPQLLLSLAWWSRDAAKVRSTPVVLLAVAAHYHQSSRFVRKYAEKILTRPDQVKDWWAIYDLLYCRSKRKFPPCMKRASNDILGAFSEAQLLKYDNNSFPRFADILKMTNFGIEVVKRSGRKVKVEKVAKPVKDYLVYGKVTNARKTPVIAARVRFNKAESFNAAAKRDALKSRVNWEVIVSKFGNTKEVWEFLIENKLVGYMATLRNLRNILNVRVSDQHLKMVTTFLVNGAVNSKQMPSGFYSAQMAIEQGFDYGRAVGKVYDPEQRQVRKVQKALDDAINEVKANLPNVAGVTAIFVDNSGSMTDHVSKMSQVTCSDAAAMMSVVARGMSDDVYIGAFGTDATLVNFRPGDSAASIKEAISRANTKGMETNGYRCIELLMSKKIKVDRIVLISDMELYNTSGVGWWGADPKQLSDVFAKYRKQVNPECVLYCINVAGSAGGHSPADDTVKGIYSLSGHSEKMLENAMISEAGGTVQDKATGETITVDPTSIIELIRAQYTLFKE